MDFSVLQNKLVAFEKPVDEFVFSQRKQMEDLRVSQNVLYEENAALVTDLKKREQQACLAEEKLSQQELQQNAQINKTSGELAELRKEAQSIGREIEAMQATLAAEKENYTTQKSLVDEKTRINNFEKDELEHGLRLISERLGLQFVRLRDGSMRIAFTKIDPKDCDRMFFFEVRSEQSFQILRCNPPIANMDKLISVLQKSNDFAAFVISVRKEFKAIAHA